MALTKMKPDLVNNSCPNAAVGQQSIANTSPNFTRQRNLLMLSIAPILLEYAHSQTVHHQQLC